MSGGLLINGRIVPVDGVAIANPTDTDWCRLSPGDYRVRRTPWCRQVIVHTTKGIWPQKIVPGTGRGGRDKLVADFFRGDPEHSASQLVVDQDFTAGCLCDVGLTAAYHATVSNDWSVGIEMYQEAGGVIYEATLDATVRIVVALCDQLDIPLQIPSRVYPNAPMQRMVDGGPDMVGIFGHRDNTSRRGRGDPGDEFYRRMIAAGAEPMNFDTREDLAVWKRRQAYLNAIFGEKLDVDGKAGMATIRAMKRHGFKHGREIPA